MSKKVQGQIRVKGELDKYIEGRISGMIQGVIWRNNVDYIPYATVKYNGDTFFRVDCTEKQFEKISKMIEWSYSKMYTIEILKR